MHGSVWYTSVCLIWIMTLSVTLLKIWFGYWFCLLHSCTSDSDYHSVCLPFVPLTQITILSATLCTPDPCYDSARYTLSLWFILRLCRLYPVLTIYSYTLYFWFGFGFDSVRYIFVLLVQTMIIFVTFSLYILGTFSVLTPCSSGAALHARRYRRTARYATSLGPQFCSLECSFDPERVFLVYTFCCCIFCTYAYLGYDGALSRHLILLCLLEACRHVCGLWVATVQVGMYEIAIWVTLLAMMALTAYV